MAASAAGSGVQLCPSTSAGGAVTVCASTADPAGASGPPSASAAVPGVSGIQQRQEASHSGRCCCRSSSDGTDRRSKRHPRGRSPSPGASSRRRERHYRSSSSSSEVDLLPKLDVRLEEHLAILAPLQLVTARRILDLRVGCRGCQRERSIFVQALVIDPLLLRERRMMTGLVPSIRWTSIGMTPSDLSWPSSGAFMPWKSLHGFHQLGARLLLHRLMV